LKDIGIFPTQYGVASLILREIPYRQEAYIRVQDVQEGELSLLLDECKAFCKACGAEKIFWTGAETDLEPAISVLRMQGPAWVDTSLLEQLFPVTAQTASRWRQIYNERMRSVPHARTLSFSDEKELTESGGAYFVHHAGELLGIGWLEDTHLLAIASCKPGAGERVAHTLMSLIEGADMTLEVADRNRKAMGLYQKLGFVATGIVSKWYFLK
jgi:GNAT superfamily N-acetyltransferase